MPSNIQYQKNIRDVHYSTSPTSITSLPQGRNGLINKGELKEYESVSRWFGNQIATAGSLKDNPPDWKNLTKEDLENMSPEQQRALFKHMPSEGQKAVANLMEKMPIDKQVALMDNMPVEKRVAVMTYMDPKEQVELFAHMTDSQKKDLVEFGVQKQALADITKSNTELLKKLKDLKDEYGTDWF